MRATSEKCTLPAIRNWQTTPLTAPASDLHLSTLRRASHETLYAIASSEMTAYNDEPMYKQIVFLLNDWRDQSLYWQINISNEFFSLRYY